MWRARQSLTALARARLTKPLHFTRICIRDFQTTVRTAAIFRTPSMRQILRGMHTQPSFSTPASSFSSSSAAVATLGVVGAAALWLASQTTTAICDMSDAFAAQELTGAARRGDDSHVLQLLSRGTDVNARHRCGWTVLHVAVANGQFRVAELLLHRGADPNAVDQYDPNVRGGSQLIRARTVEFSASVNPGSSAIGFTALHYASLFDQVAMAKLLIEAGADPSLKDATGATAADYTELTEMKSVLAAAESRARVSKEELRKKHLEEERAQRRLYPLEQRVKKFIVGQDGPISVVGSAIRRRENGWHDEDHPLVFLFLGSSGVGKTELAKRLAAYMHKDNPKGFIRIDMSEYQEKHEAAKLIGSPPGYVGHEQGGQLTAMLQKCPDAVVLLDEVEKAHPDVLNVMLQLFDEGRLTDGKGQTLDCKNAIFVMTSNLGSDLIAEYGSELRKTDNGHFVSREFKNDFIRPILKRHFQRDEFLGRIDEMVFFLPFNDAELRSLTQMELTKWAEKAKKRHDVDLTWTPDVVELLIMDYDKYYGARSLQHSVNRHVVNPLAAADEEGRMSQHARVQLQVVDGKIQLDIAQPSQSGGGGWLPSFSPFQK